MLIGAFRGWNDGGQAATLAAATSPGSGGPEVRGHRPRALRRLPGDAADVSLEDGRTRKIDWPENAFFRARIPGANRDAILLVGVEPNYRWRSFAEIVTDLARELGVELAVTLGALVADVPHTRPAPVTGAATDPHLVDELGLQLSRYEGPTGIVGVLLDTCRRAGIPSVSLWAAVPHYVPLAPSPPAAERSASGSRRALGRDRRERARRRSRRLRRPGLEAVATDSDTAELRGRARAPRRLARLVEEPAICLRASALAAELTRFLRDRESRRRLARASRPPASGLRSVFGDVRGRLGLGRLSGTTGRLGAASSRLCGGLRLAVGRRRGIRLRSLALPPSAARLACLSASGRQVVSEGVRDLADRAEFLPRMVEQRIRARCVAVGRGEQSRSDGERHLVGDLCEPVDVLLVPVAT